MGRGIQELTVCTTALRGFRIATRAIVVFTCLAAVPALGQLSDLDIAELQARGESEGWTFTVSKNPATEYSLDQLTGMVPPPDWRLGARFDDVQGDRELPLSFDWRNETGCPPVRNQGGCGSCWAFGTVGALECNILIKDGDIVDLSEQWLVSCNDDDWDCGGGWWAHDYHEYKTDPCGGTGAVMEDDFPYVAADVSCNCPYPHEYFIDNWVFIGPQYGTPSIGAIKKCIMLYGPVSVCVTSNSAMQGYDGGVFNDCSSGDINHAVVLVGWDDTQGDNGVWIMRNSWGPGWGEDGYMRIEYGCSKIGFAACYVLYGPQAGLSVTPPVDFSPEGPAGGPFTPASYEYTVENYSASPMEYSVSKAQPWITLTNDSGYLEAHETAKVTVTINSIADTLTDGFHEDTISFINETDHAGDTTRTVKLSVGEPTAVYSWNMDTNPGWTTENQWAHGHPTGGGGDYGGPDPTSGHTGSNVYGYNLDGDYASDLSETHLTAGPFDCTDLFDTHLTFWRWLGVEQPEYDHAYVRISTDGSSWATIWQNEEEVADTSWQEMEFDISEYADNESAVYLRWTMGATDSGWQYCGWNIDDVEISAMSAPEPPLVFDFPDGLPEYVDPGVVTHITLQIENGCQEYVPGSGRLHYSFNGSEWDTTTIAPLGDQLFEATLPPANCDALPEFYITAEGDGGAVMYSPEGAPDTIYSVIVGGLEFDIDDDSNSDKGWYVVNSGDLKGGAWDRGVPAGDGERGDPVEDYDGSGQCYLTGNAAGDSDVDVGYTWLVSPTLDLTGGNAELQYALWYTNDTGGDPDTDYFRTYVSNNNGATWVLAEEIGPHSYAGWNAHSLLIGDFVTPTDQVKVRFEASDENPGSIVEAAVDAVKVVGFRCESGCTTDVAPPGGDGMVDVLDLLAILSVWGQSGVPEDINGDGIVDVLDLLEVLAAWGPCA